MFSLLHFDGYTLHTIDSRVHSFDHLRVHSFTHTYIHSFTYEKKPENFLLTDKTDDAQVKVIDFG